MGKKIEVGDTVVIRGVVTSLENDRIRLADPADNTSWLWTSSVSEVIPKPWVPKEGDTIWGTATHIPYIFRAAVDDSWVYEQRPGTLSITEARFFQKDKP